MTLILGAGVAGLSCALTVAEAGGDVTLVTPGVLHGSHSGDERARAGGSTALAQGGIAAALGADDRPELHAADTCAAGVGLVDAEATQVLTEQGAVAVRALIAQGFLADRDADGSLALGLEAAHGRARIVHAGEDRTGAALHAHLVAEILRWVERGNVRLIERTTAVSLLSDSGAVSGAVLRDAAEHLSVVRAGAVVLATGGYAGLYPRSTGVGCARGEGIVLAAGLGALLADLEFVQFHPTVLAGTGMLISEAVRGAGAVLRDSSGHRFMTDAHPAAELAPRDVVARTVHRVLRERGEDEVWLDATGIERSDGRGALARRFPRIAAAAAAQGFAWEREAIPVSPAAHYTMGGVATDLDGRSSVPGLYAVGEVAATGVHGANRLASNSLLEGLVFGQRAGRAVVAAAGRHELAGRWAYAGQAMHALHADQREMSITLQLADEPLSIDAEAVLGRVIAAGLGIERDAAGLSDVRRISGALLAQSLAADPNHHTADTVADADADAVADAHAPVRTMAVMAQLMATAAAARTESRGAHQRAEYPQTDPLQARRQAWQVNAAALPAAHVSALTPTFSETSPTDPHTLRSFAAC